MTTRKIKSKLFNIFNFHGEKVIFGFIVVFFLFFSIFLALNLKENIIPDENTHLLISYEFSKTLGIPQATGEILKQGIILEHNPFLYYWINGRIISGVYFFNSTIDEWNLLIILRFFNVFLAIGTVFYCYLSSKEIIKSKYWQLLPSFLLTNTIMFVFLSSGVSYDNLANLLSFIGIFYFLRLLKKKDYLENTLKWMIFILLGTLVKMTITPLAFVMGILWLVFSLKNKLLVSIQRINSAKIYKLFIVFFLLVITNFSIYGLNIMRFGSLVPNCGDIYSQDICSQNQFGIRRQIYGLDHKLSVLESIQLGYPQPISYFFDSWIDHMLIRIYGILGHQVYYPHLIIIFYRLLFFWIFVMAIKYWKNPPFSIISNLGIFLFYVFVVFITNYNSELTYGFKQIAIQGRYIFPVISIFYMLVAYTLSKINNPKIKLVTLAYTLILFILGGPIKFIHPSYSNIFMDWFVK